ncbi:MAG TPA: hypothetical protein PKV84_01205 [Candidatus Omnitrophota bacterium]|nr:hypothetical protein [Candidatus Omnitrophota bacterium]
MTTKVYDALFKTNDPSTTVYSIKPAIFSNASPVFFYGDKSETPVVSGGSLPSTETNVLPKNPSAADLLKLRTDFEREQKVKAKALEKNRSELRGKFAKSIILGIIALAAGCATAPAPYGYRPAVPYGYPYSITPSWKPPVPKRINIPKAPPMPPAGINIRPRSEIRTTVRIEVPEDVPPEKTIARFVLDQLGKPLNESGDQVTLVDILQGKAILTIFTNTGEFIFDPRAQSLSAFNQPAGEALAIEFQFRSELRNFHVQEVRLDVGDLNKLSVEEREEAIAKKIKDGKTRIYLGTSIENDRLQWDMDRDISAAHGLVRDARVLAVSLQKIGIPVHMEFLKLPLEVRNDGTWSFIEYDYYFAVGEDHAEILKRFILRLRALANASTLGDQGYVRLPEGILTDEIERFTEEYIGRSETRALPSVEKLIGKIEAALKAFAILSKTIDKGVINMWAKGLYKNMEPWVREAYDDLVKLIGEKAQKSDEQGVRDAINQVEKIFLAERRFLKAIFDSVPEEEVWLFTEFIALIWDEHSDISNALADASMKFEKNNSAFSLELSNKADDTRPSLSDAQDPDDGPAPASAEPSTAPRSEMRSLLVVQMPTTMHPEFALSTFIMNAMKEHNLKRQDERGNILFEIYVNMRDGQRMLYTDFIKSKLHSSDELSAIYNIQNIEFVSTPSFQINTPKDLPEVIIALEKDAEKLNNLPMAAWKSLKDEVLSHAEIFLNIAENLAGTDLERKERQVVFLQILKGIQTMIALPFLADQEDTKAKKMAQRITNLWFLIGDELEQARLDGIKKAAEKRYGRPIDVKKLKNEMGSAHVAFDKTSNTLEVEDLPTDIWSPYPADRMVSTYLSPAILRHLLEGLSLSVDVAGDMVLPSKVGSISIQKLEVLIKEAIDKTVEDKAKKDGIGDPSKIEKLKADPVARFNALVKLENDVRKSPDEAIRVMHSQGVTTITEAVFVEFMGDFLAAMLLLKTAQNWQFKKEGFEANHVLLENIQKTLSLSQIGLEDIALRLVSLNIPLNIIEQVIQGKMNNLEKFEAQGNVIVMKGGVVEVLAAGGKAARWRSSLVPLLKNKIIEDDVAANRNDLPRALAAYWYGDFSSGGGTGISLAMDNLTHLAQRGYPVRLAYILSPHTWRTFMEATYGLLKRYNQKKAVKVPVEAIAQNTSRAWVIAGDEIKEEDRNVLGHGDVMGVVFAAIQGLKNGQVYAIPRSADGPTAQLGQKQFERILGFMATNTVAHVGIGNWRNLGQAGGGFVTVQGQPDIVDTAIPKKENEKNGFLADRDINLFSTFINVLNYATLLYAISDNITIEDQPLISWDEVQSVSRMEESSMTILKQRLAKLSIEQEQEIVRNFMNLLPSEYVLKSEDVPKEEGSKEFVKKEFIQWEQISGMWHGAIEKRIKERHAQERVPVQWSKPLSYANADISLREFSILTQRGVQESVPLFAEVKSVVDLYAFQPLVQKGIKILADKDVLSSEVGQDAVRPSKGMVLRINSETAARQQLASFAAKGAQVYLGKNLVFEKGAELIITIKDFHRGVSLKIGDNATFYGDVLLHLKGGAVVDIDSGAQVGSPLLSRLRLTLEDGYWLHIEREAMQKILEMLEQKDKKIGTEKVVEQYKDFVTTNFLSKARFVRLLVDALANSKEINENLRKNAEEAARGIDVFEKRSEPNARAEMRTQQEEVPAEVARLIDGEIVPKLERQAGIIESFKSGETSIANLAVTFDKSRLRGIAGEVYQKISNAIPQGSSVSAQSLFSFFYSARSEDEHHLAALYAANLAEDNDRLEVLNSERRILSQEPINSTILARKEFAEAYAKKLFLLFSHNAKGESIASAIYRVLQRYEMITPVNVSARDVEIVVLANLLRNMLTPQQLEKVAWDTLMEEASALFNEIQRVTFNWSDLSAEAKRSEVRDTIYEEVNDRAKEIVNIIRGIEQNGELKSVEPIQQHVMALQSLFLNGNRGEDIARQLRSKAPALSIGGLEQIAGYMTAAWLLASFFDEQLRVWQGNEDVRRDWHSVSTREVPDLIKGINYAFVHGKVFKTFDWMSSLNADSYDHDKAMKFFYNALVEWGIVAPFSFQNAKGIVRPESIVFSLLSSDHISTFSQKKFFEELNGRLASPYFPLKDSVKLWVRTPRPEAPYAFEVLTLKTSSFVDSGTEISPVKFFEQAISQLKTKQINDIKDLNELLARVMRVGIVYAGRSELRESAISKQTTDQKSQTVAQLSRFGSQSSEWVGGEAASMLPKIQNSLYPSYSEVQTDVMVIRQLYQEEYLYKKIVRYFRSGIIPLKLWSALRKAGALGRTVIERIAGISFADAAKTGSAVHEATLADLPKSFKEYHRFNLAQGVLLSMDKGKIADGLIFSRKFAFSRGAIAAARTVLGDVPLAMVKAGMSAREIQFVENLNLQFKKAGRKQAEIFLAETPEQALQYLRANKATRLRALFDESEENDSLAIALKNQLPDIQFVSNAEFQSFLGYAGTEIQKLVANVQGQFAIRRAA